MADRWDNQADLRYLRRRSSTVDLIGWMLLLLIAAIFVCASLAIFAAGVIVWVC